MCSGGALGAGLHVERNTALCLAHGRVPYQLPGAHTGAWQTLTAFELRDLCTQDELAKFAFNKGTLEKVEAQLEAHLQTLVDEQVSLWGSGVCVAWCTGRSVESFVLSCA